MPSAAAQVFGCHHPNIATPTQPTTQMMRSPISIQYRTGVDISMSNNSRPVYEHPIYKIIIEKRDFSLNKAIPQFAAAIDAQIDGDDASDDFIKEELHSNIHSSNIDSMTRPQFVRASGHPLPFSIAANARNIFLASVTSAGFSFRKATSGAHLLKHSQVFCGRTLHITQECLEDRPLRPWLFLLPKHRNLLKDEHAPPTMAAHGFLR